MPEDLTIGSFIPDDPGFDEWSNGTTDDPFLHAKELSATEMAQIYNSKMRYMPIQISSSVGYWPLDDQPDGTSFDGDTAVDRSGNGNDGVGNDGANGTGLTAKAEEVLSYQ